MRKNEELNNNFFGVKRISIYLYEAQLRKIDEICRKRQKSKRVLFLEAIQAYISQYEEGKV